MRRGDRTGRVKKEEQKEIRREGNIRPEKEEQRLVDVKNEWVNEREKKEGRRSG